MKIIRPKYHFCSYTLKLVQVLVFSNVNFYFLYFSLILNLVPQVNFYRNWLLLLVFGSRSGALLQVSGGLDF